MVFLTLYFQLLGMSDFAASMQMGLLLGSTAVGGLLGGWVGDQAAARFPDHGRIAVCQFSVAVGIPFSLMITKVRFPTVLDRCCRQVCSKVGMHVTCSHTGQGLLCVDGEKQH